MLRSPCLAIVAIAGCGRIGFGEAGDASTCAGTICDDFDRTSPIPVMDPLWAEVDCNAPGSALSVDGTLDVTFGAADGSTLALCQLVSNPIANVRAIQIDFDITFAPDPASESIIVINPTIILPQANAQGIQDELFQLAIDGHGNAGLVVVYSMPATGSFPAFTIADSVGLPWLTIGAPCHLGLTIDALAPAATATVACGGGAPQSLTPRTFSMEPGLSGPMTLSFGYSNVMHTTVGGSIVYDNLVATFGS